MPKLRSEAMNGKIAELLNQNIPEPRLVRKSSATAGRLVSRFMQLFSWEDTQTVKVYLRCEKLSWPQKLFGSCRAFSLILPGILTRKLSIGFQNNESDRSGKISGFLPGGDRPA